MSKSLDEKAGPRARLQHEAGFPDWRAAEAPRDGSRRRFLKQLAGGTGALIAGIPRLSHGQSLSVDFSKLERHVAAESRDAADLAEDAGPGGTIQTVARSDAFAVATDPVDLEATRADDAAGADLTSPAEDAPAVLADAPATWVEENRALWVEPGYLLLVRWERPADNEAVVAALEGAADRVAAFLAARLENVDQLHNLDQLHPIEHALVAELAPLVRPARISVLHLDHDCTQVCSALNPSRSYPERYEVMGDMAAPGWE